MTVSTSARNRANRRKGHEAERNVARYLRAHGFPHAERAVRTAYATDTHTLADPGDITGIPGIAWQIKSVAREQIESWMLETDRQAVASGADIGILIHRRQGHAEPSRWWAWLPITDLVYLTTSGRVLVADRQPVRLELGHLIPLLHRAGYGDPPTDSTEGKS